MAIVVFCSRQNIAYGSLTQMEKSSGVEMVAKRSKPVTSRMSSWQVLLSVSHRWWIPENIVEIFWIPKPVKFSIKY